MGSISDHDQTYTEALKIRLGKNLEEDVIAQMARENLERLNKL